MNTNGANGRESGAAQMPYLCWYPRDFASSTRGWPLVARAVYRELLDASWDMGGLPAAPRDLQFLIGATSREWKIAWPLVEPKFPAGDDGLRRNSRLEAHRAKALELIERRRAGAARTNASRWGGA